MNLIKNISKSEVHVLKDQVTYQEGQVVSKTLAQNDAVSITLFAFDKDEAISTHESGGDAFVTCLDGVGRITIDGVEYILHEGESIVMPAKHPHAVYGAEQFKMLISCCILIILILKTVKAAEPGIQVPVRRPFFLSSILYIGRFLLLLYIKCFHSWIYSACAKLFLNTEQLVVLCNTLRTRRYTCLDLACIKCNCKVCNRCISRLTRSV